MKKTTLLILFGFLLSWTNYGQIEVGIQNGTSNAMPINSCFAYSYSQQLLFNTDINAAPGNITSISFYFDRTTSTSNSSSSDWTIYMGHTTKTEFANNTDWIPSTALTQVFSGTVTYPAAGNQMLITFTTPFAYNSVDNLVIAVDENQPGNDCSNYFGKTGAMSSGRSIYAFSDSTNIDPAAPPVANARTNFINNVILGGLQESCPRPTNLVVTGGTSTTVDISWTENGTATEWEVLYGPTGFNPNNQGTLVLDDDGVPGLTITELTENTVYDIYVRAICGDNEQSALVGPVTFNTACGVASVPYTMNFETAVVPDLPLCTSRENAGSGNNWVTATYTSGGFNGKVLKYGYNSSNAANAWFYTQGIQLQAGEYYQITYKYGNNSTTYTEKMKVAMGTSPAVAAMTTILADYPNIKTNVAIEETVTFQVPSTGIYYFGFNAYSAANQLNLYLDDINVFVAPTCIAPSDLTVVSIGSDSAQLSWTENATATEWEVLYGPVGFDPETQGTTVTVTGTPTVTLNGLTPNTSYEFYVTAICSDDDQSFRIGPVSFITSCVPSAVPFVEGFETGYTDQSEVAGCWSQTSITGTDKWTANNSLNTYNRTPRTGNWNAYLKYGNEDWMFYPLELEGGTPYELRFYARQDGNNGDNASIMASFGTVNSPAGMTNPIVPSTPLVNGDYQELSGFFTPTTSGVYFIGIKGKINGSPWYISLDDISVEAANGCLRPGSLEVDNITDSTAHVSWTESGSATEWEVIYGPTGFDPNTAGNTVTATGTPETTITGLDPNTRYDFWVRAVCGVDDESSLSGPVSFTTSCVPADIPFHEGFETGYVHNQPLGGCWLQTSINGTDTWMVNNTFTDYNRTPYSGNWNVFLRYGNEDWMFYPLNLTGGTAYELRFFARQDGATGANASIQAAYGTSATPAGMTDIIVPNTPLINGNYQEFSEFFTPTTSGVYYIGIKGTINGSPWYISLDDISVEEASGCLRPGNLQVSNITETTADVSWTENGTATEWNVIYGPAGFDPLTQGTTIVVNGTPETTLTGLVSDSGYEFYVRSICDPNSQSGLSSVKYFFTGYCQYTSTSTSYYINNFVTDEAVQNISNTNSGQSQNGYGNFTDMVVTSFAGGEFTFNANFAGNGYSYGFNIWIDLNKNMEFEPSEKVYASGGYVTSAQGTITVPFGTPNGNYRIRIVADYLNTDPQACGTSTYGEAEDYTLMVIDVPSCMPPRNIVVGGVTETTADVSWTPFGNETEWDVIFGAPGFDPETEGTIQHFSGTPDGTITGLTASTQYEFYVRAVCDADDVSIWTGPASFVTECVILNVPYLLDFNTTIPPNVPICTSVETTGNGNTWEVANVNESGFTGKALRYKWNTNTANSWFYTQGLNLNAGVEYKISYKYGNNAPGYHEKMKVAYGTAPNKTYMTTELANYTDITGGFPTMEDIVFTVPNDGVYYFGFNVYSAADQFYLFIDDIYVGFAAACDPATDITIDTVADTSVTVSWTASTSVVDGYTVDVYLQGANPSTDTPVASEVVGNDVTTATVTGLERETSYDLYVTSDCGNGNITRSGAVNFTTTNLGVNGYEQTTVSYYPNPVKEELTVTAGSSIEKIAVYNLLGQAVLEVEPHNLNAVLNLSNLSSGTYVLRATVADAVSTFKIIKE